MKDYTLARREPTLLFSPANEVSFMMGLCRTDLDRACRTFLHCAYPDGENAIPAPRRRFLALAPDEPLESLFAPPVGQVLRTAGGGLRGYALRLGCAHFPHLKLQVIDVDGRCLFCVDTHDAIQLDPSSPDIPRWREIQLANRRLKEQIEHAWEAEGLLTFNGLLREQVERPQEGRPQ
jgi:hypothetical protein